MSSSGSSDGSVAKSGTGDVSKKGKQPKETVLAIDQYMAAHETKRPMRRLFSYMKPFKWHLTAAIVCSLINKILDLAPPILVGWVIDSVSGEPPDWLADLADNPRGTVPKADHWGIPATLAISIIVIFGLESLFQWMYTYLFHTLSQKVEHVLRMDAYRSLQSRQISYFETRATGDLLGVVSNDVNQLERFLNDGLNELVQLAGNNAVAAVVLLLTSWQLTLIGAAPLPIIVVFSFYYTSKISHPYSKVRAAVADLNARVENNIGGIKVIKAFTAEDFEQSRLEDVSLAYKTANYDAIRLSASYIPMIRMVVAVGFALVILFGAMWTINPGTVDMTVGDLVLFSMMIQRLLWPLVRLGQTVDSYQRAKASIRRIFTLLDSDAAIVDPDNAVSLGIAPSTSDDGGSGSAVVTRRAPSIAFDNVTFRYQPELPAVLDGLSLDIAAGETIGIAGTTGAGKSTLIKLLLRFYDVNTGTISINGVDIRRTTQRELRDSIAFVSQEVYIFQGTLFENIAYGHGTGYGDAPEALVKRVVQAAKQAQLHDFIDSLPNGYDSLVGERGVKLSGGQRSRLSIARAILKGSPIVLLDESTASVDSSTEAAIQQALDLITEDRTSLIIAHRLSTIRNADRIIVLREGRVLEQGTHDALVAANGAYAQLWRVQTGEREHHGGSDAASTVVSSTAVSSVAVSSVAVSSVASSGASSAASASASAYSGSGSY